MSQPFIGEIKIVGFNFAPRGFALCDGALLAISQNTALFSLLGTTYGGDGRTSFGLPDLRGRVPKHVGNGPGLTAVSWGQRSGAENHTLSVNQLPAHNHPAVAHAHRTAGTSANPSGNYWSLDDSGEKLYSPGPADATMNPGAVTTSNIGGNQPVNNLDPFLGVFFCIALQGIFPSRN